jgi:IclR family mhp operon transcriptional activator
VRRSVLSPGRSPGRNSQVDAVEKGVPIRSISRCIAVLQAINRHGSLSLNEIAQAAKVPYPTACRIIQTLVHEGFIEREPHRKHYRPTVLVQSLSNGFQSHDRLVQAARSHIVDLTRRLNWPVSVATRVGQNMVVRDSTHALTSLTFSNYYPGYTLPILECASGRACLAFSDPAERKMILDGVRQMPAGVDPHTLAVYQDESALQQIRDDGYASKGRNQHNATPGKTSSLAVPLFENGELVGTLSLIFFASAMKVSEAVSLYIGELKTAAERISADLAACEQIAA